MKKCFDRIKRHVLACHDEESLVGSWIILDTGNDLSVFYLLMQHNSSYWQINLIVNLARWLIKEVGVQANVL